MTEKTKAKTGNTLAPHNSKASFPQTDIHNDNDRTQAPNATATGERKTSANNKTGADKSPIDTTNTAGHQSPAGKDDTADHRPPAGKNDAPDHRPPAGKNDVPDHQGHEHNSAETDKPKSHDRHNDHHRSDESAPTVTGIAITGAIGIRNNILNTGDKVNITVKMSDEVTVTGSPTITIDIGGTLVQATYMSGSGSADLVFSYTVQAGQNDANGISVVANSLSLNGGKLTGTDDNPAVLNHAAITDAIGFQVDTLAPTVSNVAISSATGIQNHILNAGDELCVTVTLSEATFVTGSPTITLDIGGTLVQATYASGSGSTGLVFSYTVQAGLVDVNGIGIVADSLNLNGGSLTDAAGNLAVLGHVAVADNSSFMVNTLPPTVAGVAIGSALGSQNNILNAGDTLSVSVTMSDSVTVTGSPTIDLDIGGSVVQAVYVSGSGSANLVFSYTVQAGLVDANGIGIVADSLNLNGGSLTDAAGNLAVLGHVAVADNSSFMVNTLPPTVAGVAIGSALGSQNNILNAGDTLSVSVTMSDSVTVTGSPTIDLDIGGTLVQATYVAGSGSANLVFSYTVQAGLVDANGIGIVADSLSLNGGSLTDAAGNLAVLGHVAVADNSSFMVNTLPPTVAGVAIGSALGSQNNILNAGDTLSVSVTMSDSVTVTGSPTIDLDIGGSVVQAVYVSGSGSADLVFSYTIQTSQVDSNGLSVVADSLTLNGGSLTDAAGNTAVLSYASVADNSSFRVDTAAPTLISSNPADNATAINSSTNIVLTFSETVMAGNGSIVISNGISDTRIIAISDTSQVTISGNTVTINPTTNLIAGSTYSVQLASGVLLDLGGNPYAGLTNSIALNFTVLSNTSAINLSAIASGTGGFVLNGQSVDDQSGWTVASAGDVNGDGLADLVVGAPYSDPAAGGSAGRSYVVFGKTDSAAIDLSTVAAGIGGFVLNGQRGTDQSGISVAAAGDVNGDGLADVIIGAAYSDPAAGVDAGRSYVVFGKTDSAAIDLSAVAAGIGGFVLNGQSAIDQSGISVASAGDVNGDGLADLLVGAPFSGSKTGRSYVVFGKTDSAAINLSAVAAGIGGFAVVGQSDDHSGWSAAGAGDVNGDGLADLVIGARYGDPSTGVNAGRSYVVFGKTGTAAINLSAVAAGTGGFVLNGQGGSDSSGWSVAGAGDVNGDGLADVIIGAPNSDPAAGVDAGRSYVVFGKTDSAAIDLAAVAAGIGGFVLNGQGASDYSGWSVAGAGDINGDGLADLIVGAYLSDPATGVNAGRSYVVFGKSDSAAIDLSAVAAGIGGFVINGQSASDCSGYSVAAGGDINGDGLADLIVGARYSDPSAGINAGRSYVIFGATDGIFAETAVDQLGTGGDDTLTGTAATETLVGGAGNDTLTGAGGADVLYGGAGDDLIIVNADTVAALSAGFGAGGNTTQLARIDGGAGLDTLALDGANIALNLTAIANQGGSTPGSSSRIESFERIDLTGSGDNTLTLGLNDVLDMAGMNLINSSTQAALGWNNGSYDFAARESRHQLIIDGNAGDTAILNGGTWRTMGTVSHNGNSYTVYNSNYTFYNNTAGLAQVLVADSVAHDVLADTTGPTIDSIGITSAAGVQNNILNAGDVVTLTLIMSETVFVTGTPQVALNIGNDTVQANYVAGSETNTLVFTYTILAAQHDANGISISADSLTLNGGSLTDVAGNNAVLSHAAVADNAGYRVNAVINLSDIASGTGGFVLNGQSVDDQSGWSVASAGDVNGDGLADLVVGAPYSDPAAGGSAGRSYVVFGKTDSAAIDLSAVAAGIGGFALNGQRGTDQSGISVAAAGDVNGDGLADVIIGAAYSDPAAGVDAGRSYVVFGKTDSAAIDLSAVAAGIGGFVLNGQSAIDQSGISVASAGDVNGDGLADLLVGAPFSGSKTGRSYVVFGKTDSAAINLSAVAAGIGGFAVVGQSDDHSGWSAAGAGDVNGDGLADLVIGARYGDPSTGVNAGRSYVVFGKTGTAAINLSAVAAGTGGFVLNGQGGSDSSGWSVAGAGDVNGDGLADVIIGAPNSDPAAGVDAGRSYVVFGKTDSAAIDLAAVAAGIGGFVLNGQGASDYSGWSVAGAGDINGDGLADLIVGAYLSDPATGVNAGRSYVVFGKSDSAAIDLSAVAAGIGGFVINGQSASDCSGYSVAAGGDINGDGLADLIVGARYSDPSAGINAGRSYVIFGATDGIFAETAVDQLGTGGDDTLTGTAATETLVGGAGNDTLTGAGGADVLYGGAGDDLIIVNADTVAALSAGFGAGGNTTQLARIDGGAGLDTLALDGANIALNLTAIANQGGSTPGSSSRIESIERIDLTGSGDNSLTLGLNDVLDMSGLNNFNNANGWTDGTYNLAAGGANGINPEQRHQVVIDGNAGDAVTSSGWGASVGTVINNGHTYDIYNQGNYAQLLIDHSITQTVI